MKILLVKLSSLGDTIHTLPSITDIRMHYPACHLTWAIEPAFADIAAMHPGVDRVLTTPLRQAKQSVSQLRRIYRDIQDTEYDHIIDAQGLVKSGIISRIARGNSTGYCYHSAREAIASYCYTHTYTVATNQHAVWRTKSLCAQSLGYTMPNHIDFALRSASRSRPADDAPIFLFHGTTWDSKHYPESHWQELIQLMTQAGHRVVIPWGNAHEHARATRLARHPQVTVLPKLSLRALMPLIESARGAIGVDTGLSHLAGALGTPCVGLYGPTDHTLAGNIGENQIQISTRRDGTIQPRPSQPLIGSASKDTQHVPPYLRMDTIKPQQAWQALQTLWTSSISTAPHEAAE